MTHRILIVLGLCLMLVAIDANACSCFVIADPLATVEATDAVFRARVLTTVMVLTNDDGSVVYKNERETPTGYAQRLVVLRVEEVFKGEVVPVTVLVTGSGGGDCGYEFEDGKEYLVFATISSEKRVQTLARSSEVLTTSICSSTQPLEKAAELFASLSKKYASKEPVWVSWSE